MKTVIEEQQQATAEWKFPCLAKSTMGRIIFITGKNDEYNFKGIVLSGSDIGHYEHDWDVNALTPITTPLTITFIPE